MAKNSSAGTGFAPPEEVDVILYNTIPLSELALQELSFEEIENTLPVGLHVDGECLRDVVLHPYSSKYDRMLGQILKGSGSKFVNALAQFLPLVIKSIGGYSIEEIAGKLGLSTSRAIQSIYFGDIMTLILMLRKESQGTSDIAISAVCPACGTKNEDDPAKGRPYHNIDTVDIVFLKSDIKPLVEVNLADGLDVFGEKITKLIMQPLKLHQIERIAKSEDGEPEDIAMLYEMVTAIPESEAYKNVKGKVFSDELYDKLTRADLKILRQAIKKLQPGPKMSIAMECYNLACGNEWEENLSWVRLREFLYVPIDSD